MSGTATASGWRLRETVVPADEAAVREIVASSGFFHDFEVEVAAELVRERLARGPASGYHFIFADDRATGRTIGYTCFGPIACTVCSLDLYWVAVRQDRRGSGLGLTLMASAERRVAAGLPGAGAPWEDPAPGRRIYVETSGREQYAPTQRFYERAGYRLEARLASFYAPGDDKLVYVKALP